MAGIARTWDAVIIGSGPNGLAAAALLAEAGLSVLVIEAADQIGGGVRSLPLTLPGFVHDVCSAIHPIAAASPVFGRMPLATYGLEWVHPEAPLAHPLDNGRAVILEQSLTTTAGNLGRDAGAYHHLFAPVVRNWEAIVSILVGRVRLPGYPWGLPGLARTALRSAMGMLDAKFRSTEARALLAGIAGHSNLPLEDSPTAGFALALGGCAHTAGWPFPRGGAGKLAAALASYLRSLGVEFETGVRVNSLDELPASRVVLCDLSPRELLRIAASRFPTWYQRKLQRFPYGPGAFKIDWALDGPIPWSAPECGRAATVHLGGTAEEIAASERATRSGHCAETPMVIAAQHTLFDPLRAPPGKHTAWAYCHVPNGSTVDMTERIERQFERFAPGFRNRILARSVLGPVALESHNPNLVGGDIAGGDNHISNLLARPTLSGYRTPEPRVLICSSSTPPGAGVHGICGYFAARAALRRLRRRSFQATCLS